MSHLLDDDAVMRCHAEAGLRSEAIYSACGLYRYSLTRVWDDALPSVAFVMLNPSTASEVAEDPTVARCVRRARDGGWGAVRVCNLFALRETSPARLKAHPRPEGPHNGRALEQVCDWADAVVPAWGVHGTHRGRGAETLGLLRQHASQLLHLGLTRGGHPRHPLYISYRVPLQAWE